MHREIRDHIEDVLRGGDTLKHAREHLAQCDECRTEVQGMQEQTALIRELRAPEDFAADLRPGELQHSRLDISRAELELDWAPRVAIAEGLHRTYEALVESFEQE